MVTASSASSAATVVLPLAMTNGNGGGGTNGSSPTYTPPVTVTPVTPASSAHLNHAVGPAALTRAADKTSAATSSSSSMTAEPPSPPAKKWRSSGHLASDKVSFVLSFISSCNQFRKNRIDQCQFQRQNGDFYKHSSFNYSNFTQNKFFYFGDKGYDRLFISFLKTQEKLVFFVVVLCVVWLPLYLLMTNLFTN